MAKQSLLDKALEYTKRKHATRGSVPTKAQAEVIVACLAGDISVRSMLRALKIQGGNVGRAFHMLRSSVQAGKVRTALK